MPDGRRLTLPTDVQEVGITRFSYDAGQTQIHLGLPTAVGGSVASLTGKGWGTLGLRVKDIDNTNEYVLTCCHVLCGHLINRPDWKYNSAVDGLIQVVVPFKDAPNAVIGEVAMASFNSREDFALVRLTDSSAVSAQPFGQDVIFA